MDELRVAHAGLDALDGLKALALLRDCLRSCSCRGLLLDLSHEVGVLRSHFFEGHGFVSSFVFDGRGLRLISSRSSGVDAVVDRDRPGDVSEVADVVPDTSHEEHLLVCAQGGRRARVVEQGIGEAVVDRLLTDHPRLAGHHAAELVDLDAGLGVVDLRDGPLAGVEVLLELLQVLQVVVVPQEPADAVDHDHTAGVDLHLVAGAHDDAGRAGSDALHDDGLGAAQALDRVVNGDAGVEVAAAAIDLDGDVALVLHGSQILEEAFGGDVEAGLRLARPPVDRLAAHDVAVEQDLARVVAGAGDVPELLELAASRRRRGRPRDAAGRVICFHGVRPP